MKKFEAKLGQILPQEIEILVPQNRRFYISPKKELVWTGTDNQALEWNGDNEWKWIFFDCTVIFRRLNMKEWDIELVYENGPHIEQKFMFTKRGEPILVRKKATMERKPQKTLEGDDRKIPRKGDRFWKYLYKRA